MNKNLTRLAERRNRLVDVAAAQRVRLVQDIMPWRIPLLLGDRCTAAWHYMKQNPVWLIAGVTLVMALGPGRVGSWLGRGLLAWRMVDNMRGSTNQYTPRPPAPSPAN